MTKFQILLGGLLGKDFQDSSSSDEEGNKAFGKTSQAFPSKESDGSQNGLPSHHGQSQHIIIPSFSVQAYSVEEQRNCTYLWLFLIMVIIEKFLSTYQKTSSLAALISDLPPSVSDTYETILGKRTDNV